MTFHPSCYVITHKDELENYKLAANLCCYGNISIANCIIVKANVHGNSSISLH